jgi:hypothetical protein
MELTRRDALVAAAGAAGIAAVGDLADRIDGLGKPAATENVLSGLNAVAVVVYPSAVDATTEFLRTFLLGKEVDEEGYVDVTSGALDALDRRARDRYGRDFAALSPDTREECLRAIGVPDIVPDPDGTAIEEIRYYVVDQLLYALYTSPTGGRLLGNENPPGHPGGREAYQRGPDDG